MNTRPGHDQTRIACEYFGHRTVAASVWQTALRTTLDPAIAEVPGIDAVRSLERMCYTITHGLESR